MVKWSPQSLRRTVLALLILIFATACQEQRESRYQGYVEGDYLYLAAPYGGYLETLEIERGSRADAGTPLFSLSAEPEIYTFQEAEAKALTAQEKLRNLELPRRQSEIAVMQAELRNRQAQLNFSTTQLARMESLIGKGFVSKERLDDARQARDRDAAQVDAAREELAVYQENYGRRAEIQASEAEFQAAQAVTALKRWQIVRKSVTAPANGEISEIYFRPGEWVPAGQAVVSFLPDQRRLIRFFVPERELVSFSTGQRIEAECDGCPSPIQAKVTFIAAKAEYTPPVIYSREARAKLVFRIEAKPAAGVATALHPGLPVDVRLLEKAS